MDINTPDYINLFVAIGTIGLAVASFVTIKESKKSIKAAERSAEATEISVERMKDSLMPHLALDVFKANDGIALFVRNVGGGLAKIRLITIRNDIRVECVIDDPISYYEGRQINSDQVKGKIRLLDFVFAKEDEYTFLLESNPNLSRVRTDDWFSSLTIYYEDIYGRFYSNRLLYVYKHFNNTSTIQTIGTEYSLVNKLPLLPTAYFEIDNLVRLEGEISFIYRPQFKLFYFKKFIDKNVGISLTGNSFTNNQNGSGARNK